MALGLDQLPAKKTSAAPARAVGPALTTRRPWGQVETNVASETPVEETVELFQSATPPAYADIARQAVERARQIVERNELMLQEMYARRQGRNLHSLELRQDWSSKDENLFYLQDFVWDGAREEQQGMLTRLKKIFSPKH